MWDGKINYLLQTLSRQVNGYRSSHPEVFFKKGVLKNLNANPTKYPNTPKQFVGNLSMNCLNVFDHSVNLAFKGLRIAENSQEKTCAFLTKLQATTFNILFK